MTEFRVVDIRGAEPYPEHTVTARTPIEAAHAALGLDLIRAGVPRNLVCKVYWSEGESPFSMLRLYKRVLALTS